MFRVAAVVGVMSSVLPLAVQPADRAAVTLDVRYYDQPGVRGLASLSAGGRPCQLAWTGRETARSCAFTVAPGATEIAMTGEYARDERPARGTMRWRVIDMGPMLAPLRDPTRPMGDRFRAFQEEKAAFEARYASVLEGFDLSVRQPDAAAAIAGAEKRLGFALPGEHRHLLSTVGPFDVGDSSMTPAADIKRSYNAMIDDWETPKATLDREISAATRALLESTALLYTQVGDGLGALLYRPSGESACGSGPAYYRIHQDEIDEPVLLQRSDGACVDYAGALIATIAEDGLQRYEDTGPGVVVIDRSAPAPQRVLLSHAGVDRGFEFDLRLDWAYVR